VLFTRRNKAWNELPTELQDLNTDQGAFRRQLKTFLFERAFTIHSDSLAAGHLGVSDGQIACAFAFAFWPRTLTF